MKPRKNKPGIVPIYDESLKIAVARDYLTGNFSASQVAEKYNLPKGDVVHYFVKWYKKNYGLELSQTVSSPPAPNEQRIDSQQQTNISQELSDARLKIAALEIMIQIAEQELGIDIRKKSGTKQ
jgi:transposase-like protein